MSDGDIDRARLRTVRARARLTDALATLKRRLLPGTLARKLWQTSTDKAVDAAAAGADAVRHRPGAAAGVAALVALFLARKPIARAWASKKSETPARPARSPAKPPRKARR